MQDISWNGGALPTPTKYPAYSKKDSQWKWKPKQTKKIKNKKRSLWKICQYEDVKEMTEKKILVAQIGGLKPLFSMQDEQLIKTATKISV